MSTPYLRLSLSPRSWPSWPSLPWRLNPISNGGTGTRSLAGGRATEREALRGVPLSLAGIAKSYGPEGAAIDGVDLDVQAGELLALLGPSGSGKTTLLRVIAGLEIPDAGRVHFGEQDVTGLPVQERRIGFVFQHYALFRHLTVFDNVAYGLRARKRARPSEAEVRVRVSELLELVQLDGLAERRPAQLSGGQRQCVALARALATSPRVLLLDEPFGALDARVRKDLRRWLRDIHRETGQTTIFVTHDQDEALELADRVAILNRGRLEQVGSPDEIHDAPSSSFVASFVGDGLSLPVTIEHGVVIFSARPLRDDAAGLPDGLATLHVRPDQIRIDLEGRNHLTGIVQSARRVSRGRRLSVSLGEVSLEMEVGLQTPGPDVGAEIGLAIEGGHLFARG